jgi:hypothetical protein
MSDAPLLVKESVVQSPVKHLIEIGRGMGYRRVWEGNLVTTLYANYVRVRQRLQKNGLDLGEGDMRERSRHVYVPECRPQ